MEYKKQVVAKVNEDATAEFHYESESIQGKVENSVDEWCAKRGLTRV